jgi:hypothetical protein
MRNLHPQEKQLLATLLLSNPDGATYVSSLDNLQVQEMNDGGMGSLRLYPTGDPKIERRLGKSLAQAEFTDDDEVLVSVVINLDDVGKLYEFDVWKVDFSPLIAWPMPNKLKIKK